VVQVRFNELVLRLIESPAHHLMPSGLNRIAYTGPVSGEAVRLPVHSVADGSRFLVVACRPEQKRWWRTFRCPQRARLTRAGRRYDVIGRVLTSQERADALTLYTAAQLSSARGINVNTPVIAFTRPSRTEGSSGLSAGQEVSRYASPPVEELS
jgi:hypothetical protein